MDTEAEYQKIPLTRGAVAIIDKADFEALNAFSWHAVGRGVGHYYAVRKTSVNGKRVTVSMHRMLMGNENNGILTDHLNGNRLDNRRANLRLATYSENAKNRPGRGVSSYMGVSWDGCRRQWMARITFTGKQRTIGRYNSEEQAARAYDEAARATGDAFYRINFPMES